MNDMIVAAVDVSGSTSTVDNYFTKVQKILEDVTLPLKIILWSDRAYFYQENVKLDLQTVASCGGTEPEVFVQLLKDFNGSFHLYIFTDGMISDLSVTNCKKHLEEYNIFDKLIDVKLYYIGSESDMNLKMTDIFVDIPQEIFINDIVKSVGTMNPNLDLNCIDYEFVMKDGTLKATILSQLNSGNVDKVVLKQDLQILTNRILKSISDKDIIEPFYAESNITDCVKFIKQNCNFPKSKAEFQRKMADILKLFDRNIDTYSLDVLKKINPIELEYDEPEEEFEDVTCDILYENCKTICFPVKKITEVKTQYFDGERKLIQNPFRLLQSNEILNKIIKLVEPYIMDYETFKKIQNKISPFTRDVLQGVYVLHNDTLDKTKLIQNNSFVLSVLFGDKLPGNKVLWNIVFLYALAKNHKFSKYKELLFQEIIYLGEHFRHFITLTPYMNPPYHEKLNVCFWYIAQVSHIAYPNSKKNLLRSMDAAPVFLEFYNDVYGKVNTPNEMNLWQLWKYFVLHKSNPSFIFYILAHHLNYKLYKSGAIVLFYGEHSETLENSMDYITNIDVSIIMALFNKLMSSSNVTPYEDLSKELHVTEENYTISSDFDIRIVNNLDHVTINIKTCHPFVMCKITGKHWKECAGNYDQRKESYLRLFRRYCIKKKMYPESFEDLIIYLNNYLLRHQKKPEIFPKSVENILSKVFSLFKNVMEVYSCEEYLKTANKYFREECRLKME